MKLISMELDKFKIKAKELYELDFEFGKSVNTIIYKEGVFPTQGTRPIFTTINTLIESYASKIIADILLNNWKTEKIIWNFIDETGEYEIQFIEKNKIYKRKYSIKLKLENLRKSTKDDSQAHVAVHESGHAVASCVILGLIPEEIVSKTAGNKNGYCRVKMPQITTKDLIKKDISVGLGGYVAEKLIFGEELLSAGSCKDIEMVTQRAIAYVKTYGMTGFPILVGLESDKMNDSHHFDHESTDREDKKLVHGCQKTTERIIKTKKTLLVNLSQHPYEN